MHLDAALRSIVEDKDFISSKRLFDDLSIDPNVVCVKRDFLFRSGNFCDADISAVLWRHSRDLGDVLVTGHSSFPFRSGFMSLLRSRGIKHVFALNAKPSRHVSPLPLGLTSQLSISPDHLVLGNHDLIREAWAAEPERPGFNGSVYVSVTPGTSSFTRRRLQEVLSGLPNVVQRLPDKSREGRIQFLRSVRRANFTPAPRGVGSDTHRLWEVLYMGGIPVILPDKRINSLVSGLPVLVVDDWSRLADRGFLKESWERIVHSSYRLERLRVSSWVALISKVASGYRRAGS